MKKVLRTFGLAAAIVGSLGLGTTPANAAGAAVFGGEADIACFGCGVSSGTARICVKRAATVGPIDAWVRVCIPSVPFSATAWNATASYTVNEPADVTCVISGAASGSVSGALNVDFNWTRIGAIAVITTSGEINGAGVAAFAVTSPVGNPCGGPVEAVFFGALAGA